MLIHISNSLTLYLLIVVIITWLIYVITYLANRNITSFFQHITSFFPTKEEIGQWCSDWSCFCCCWEILYQYMRYSVN